MMTWTHKYRPTVYPVSLAQAKLHLRLDDTNEDTRVSSLIAVATDYAERFTGRQLVAATLELAGNQFPSCGSFFLPRPPALSVSSITYIDLAGNTSTVSTSVYQLDPRPTPARVVNKYAQFWPSARTDTNSVIVTWTAGHAIPVTCVSTTDVFTSYGALVPSDGSALRIYSSGGATAAVPTGLSDQTDYYARDVSGSTFKLAASVGGAAIDISDTGVGTLFISPTQTGKIPDPIIQAILLLVGHWYENREEVVVGTITARVPTAAESLLWMHRSWTPYE